MIDRAARDKTVAAIEAYMNDEITSFGFEVGDSTHRIGLDRPYCLAHLDSRRELDTVSYVGWCRDIDLGNRPPNSRPTA